MRSNADIVGRRCSESARDILTSPHVVKLEASRRPETGDVREGEMLRRSRTRSVDNEDMGTETRSAGVVLRGRGRWHA